MAEEKSLKDTLAEVSSKLDQLAEQKKVKKWNLPLSARFGMGKKKKRKGYVVFINIGENKALTFIKAPVDDGVAIVNDIPHHVKPEDVLIWKNKIPVVIQPQWSERPFSADSHYQSTLKNNENTMGWKYIVNYINKNQIQQKKNFPTGLLIIGLIALVGLGYYLIKSGALKG